MVAAMAAFWGGTALVGRRPAFLGAAIFGMSILLTTESHIAKTDAALVAAITMAMAALARLHARGEEKRRGDSVIFWVALAIGILIKGPIAPMVVGLAAVMLVIWERKLNWAKPLTFWVGPSLFFIIAIPWFVAIEIATGGAFLREAAGVDMAQKALGAAEGHGAPPGLHLMLLPLLLWPGTVVLIPGLWRAIRRIAARTNGKEVPATTEGDEGGLTAEQEGAGLRFLACWIIPAWLVFELAPTKLIHYTLPAYPAIALLCGAALDQWFSTNTWNRGRWISLLLFSIAAFVFIAFPSPWALDAARADAASTFTSPLLQTRVEHLWALDWRNTGISVWPMMLIALATVGTIFAIVQQSPRGLLVGLLACSLSVGFTYRTIVLPNQSWILSTLASLDALEELCALPLGAPREATSNCEDPAPPYIQTVGYSEPSLVFNLAGNVRLEENASTALPDISDHPRPAWLLNTETETGAAALRDLIATAAASDRCIRFARRYAYNYSNSDPVALVAVVIEPAGCANTDPALRLRPAPATPDSEGELLDTPDN